MNKFIITNSKGEGLRNDLWQWLQLTTFDAVMNCTVFDTHTGAQDFIDLRMEDPTGHTSAA